MPEFSVIVPVYKVEKYIGRCIESILAQSFSDFELILVDDGSPDKSGQICEQYAAFDKRINVIHQENGGVSKARNTGLMWARGRFIVFVDSDDTIENNYLSYMADVDKNVDLVICGIKRLESDGTKREEIYGINQSLLGINEETLLQMVYQKAINYAFGKRFKKDILQKYKIYFDEQMSLGEDTVFVANYLMVCKNLQYVVRALYKYYMYSENTLSSLNENYVERLEIANTKVANILSAKFNGITKTREWKARCFSVYYYAIFFALKNNKYCNRQKYNILKGICGMPRFGEFARQLDVYMWSDSKILQRIISTKKPMIIILFWELLKLKSRIEMFLGLRRV